MSDELKFIIGELAKSPFSKTYNLISFDSLEPLQLLQVLTDVLADIDPKQKVDVREEAADQTAIRVFGILRILKYKPPTDSQNLSQFRQGIVQGEKQVIYPILHWMLSRMGELKKRAYLGRYLVKVDIPPDFMQDEQINELFQQYERLIEEFKLVHKQAETLKMSGFNTGDIKKDISSMEEEKDQLIRRVERLKKKVEASPNSGPMLAMARNLRTERDRDEKIHKQKTEQKNHITQLEHRINRLQHQIKDTKQSSIGATPQGLLHKLDEETRTNEYMVKEKLPKELAAMKKAVSDLQRVVQEPAMGQSDLDAIHEKIKTTNTEMNQLIEKRMMSADPMDDKLSLFRQQAAIIARKKESAATLLQESRERLVKAEFEAEEKRSQVNRGDGETVLKGDDFKRYVNKLRSKSTVYKKKRQEISDLRAESGVLARTEEILKQRDEDINRKLSRLEKAKGVSGYRETQEALENVSSIKSDLDQMKGRTLEDISHMVQQLTRRISDKKSALAPIIKDLRPLRQKNQELTAEYNEKKQKYDTVAAGFESNRAKLEQEVRAFREEIGAEESRFHYLSAMTDVIKLQLARVEQEMKSYVSHDPQERKKTFREQYSRKVQEQENLSKTLRDRQKYVRENQDDDIRQMKMWRDFDRIMEMKLQLSKGGYAKPFNLPPPSHVYQDSDHERLVL